jgi:hypothetical protein
MNTANEYWMSQILRENPALFELLRDFGYTKDDWDELDPSEKEHLNETAASCYHINHGMAPLEKDAGQSATLSAPRQVQVSACKLW